MLWTKANQLIEIVNKFSSVTKERSKSHSNYHNIIVVLKLAQLVEGIKPKKSTNTN